ncbi:MAG: 2-hydroxyacyl-CoA dehydratase family protein [Thermodesulfobacteriota bacterium]
MPLEIMDAAGILPVRLRGVGTEGMGIGDTYFGPFICRFPKALLQNVGQGRYRFLDGAVISTGCDALRRMDDCWRKAGEDIPGIVPSFFHYFDVPQKVEAHARQWFSGQIRKLIRAVEEHFGVRVSDEALKEAIRMRNRIRVLLWKLEGLRRRPGSEVSGAEAFGAVIAGAVLPPELFEQELAAWIAELEEGAQQESRPRPRILVGGSVSDDLELINLLEQAGARVVAENLCFGVRHAEDRVALEGDPVDNLTARYLSESVCPRMFGNYKTRFKLLREKARDAGADAVILENVRFCDLHASENGLLEHDFEKMGIPCMRLEREYGPLSEGGRLNMRITAFLENLQWRKGVRRAS